MTTMKKTSIFIICLITIQLAAAQTTPTFNADEDPSPKGKKWELVPTLSDEFDGNSLDEVKWKNTDPSRWVGRAPGIFKTDVSTVSDGNLKMLNYLLPQKEVVNGNEFTHAGGHLISRNKGQVGQYFECRMKANKTFMSSTFWLISYANENEGCDRRVTELDIQECVGELNTTASWASSFDQSMHSNTHSRNVTCSEPTGSKGGNAATPTKVYEDYHVYGAWWKSPTEIHFFLNGNHVNTVTPVAEFSLPMYIKLVTETYDWNPVPADGGMSGSEAERTTSYDWVRVWSMVDAPEEEEEEKEEEEEIILGNATGGSSIYPNPLRTGMLVAIETYGNEPFTVQIFNLGGHVVYGQNNVPVSDRTLINLTGISSGIYLVELKTKSESTFHRLVVE